MKRLLLSVLLIAAVSCQQKLIYQNDSYALYADRAVQGDYTAVAESPYRIVSDFGGDSLVWEKKNDHAGYPALTTPYPVEAAVYNMSVDECINAVEPDGTLRTGLEWGGVWTRDVSYSTILSMAYMQPQAAMTSLLCKINSKGEIVQDTGTGGAWPCSTDRMIWVGAAWEIYKVTGDRQWLETVYPVAKKSLEVDMRTIYDEQTGLAKGESSFIDWRKNSYPLWMESADIYDSKCLGTNVVHYIALSSAAKMGRLLSDERSAEIFEAKAADVKAAVNGHLWMDDKGYYAQYLAGRDDDLIFTKSETLGHSLAVLYGVAEGERASRLSQSMPVMEFGAPVFWPFVPDQGPYHNRAVWPFVQSYWVLASAKTGNEQGVLHGVAAVWRAAMMYATNKENFVANDGNWRGTHVNSSNMLWSLSGSLGITFRTLMGISYDTPDALRFAPVVPEALRADRTVTGFRYRDAVLDINVKGYGDVIRSFSIDGQKADEPVFPASMSGHHTIDIVLADRFDKDLTVNMVDDVRTPKTPFVRFSGGGKRLRWYAEEGAVRYDIYAGGQKVHETVAVKCDLDPSWNGDISVVAVAADGTPSFPSEPLNRNEQVVGHFEPVMLLYSEGRDYRITVDVPSDGLWSLSWNYANARGSLYSDLTCGIRMLYVDGRKVGINVFPNRHYAGGEPDAYSTDGWDIWGWTSPEKLSLTSGRHVLTLRCEGDADNMSRTVNDFMIKGYCLTRN
ncbi:MAG: glycogen debranching protein [Bacteroidales bacterium]|nr:glycogen debranching protein [Bacteroidales bacterium]